MVSYNTVRVQTGMQNSDKLSDGENEVQRLNLHMKLSKTVSKMQIEEMANARKSEFIIMEIEKYNQLERILFKTVTISK